MLRASSVVVLGLIVVASCFGGPPNAPVSGTLGPGPHGAAPRASAGFAVAFAGPRGVVTDLTQPAVTVLFNHAAHDPDAADTEALPAVSVATEQGQAVAGAWQWVGSHGLIFTPDHTLPGSTRFVVTIAAGAKALDGDALGTDYRFEFTTARPAVEGTAPDDGATDLRPDSVVRIQFNQPMDPGEVERAVHAVARDRSGAEQPVAFHASRATSGPAAERTVLLTPAAPLPLDRAIDVALPRGLRGQGPLATTSAHELSFRTYGPLRLADVRCPRATGPRCQAHRDFTIVLSNAVAPAEFKAHFKAPDLPLQKPDAEEETKESKKEARKRARPAPRPSSTSRPTRTSASATTSGSPRGCATSSGRSSTTTSSPTSTPRRPSSRGARWSTAARPRARRRARLRKTTRAARARRPSRRRRRRPTRGRTGPASTTTSPSASRGT